MLNARNGISANWYRVWEQTVIDFLAAHGVNAIAQRKAPGVYVADKKICSLGLRIRRGCAYHGLALNVAMDLTPFNLINPCGYAELEMTQVKNIFARADNGCRARGIC